MCRDRVVEVDVKKKKHVPPEVYIPKGGGKGHL